MNLWLNLSFLSNELKLYYSVLTATFIAEIK